MPVHSPHKAIVCAISVVTCALVFAAGCGGDDVGKDSQDLVGQETILETDTRGEEARVGVPFKVDCRLFVRKPGSHLAPRSDSSSPEVSGALGQEISLPGPATVVVGEGPAPVANISGRAITFTKPGVYKLRCVLPAGGLQDTTPATITVVPGPSIAPQTDVRVVATDKPATVVDAGTELRVSCAGTDAYGNTVTSGWKVTTSASVDSASAPKPEAGVAFTVKRARKLVFACSSGGHVDTTPAVVEVQAAPPKHLYTTLSPKEAEAGHASEITCKATDDWGNPIANFPFSIAHSDKLTLKKLYVTTTVAGKHAVKCVPETIAWKLFEIHGALLSVIAGPPAELLVTKVPDKGVYKRYSKVKFVPLVRDKFGNTVEGIAVSMKVEKPAKGFKVLADKAADKRIEFNDDGVYMVAFAVANTALKSVQKVLVDGAPPLVTIDYPPWGSTLSLKPSIQLKGKAGDKDDKGNEGSGVADLHVNGIKTFPDAADDWYLQVGAKHGLNPVVAVVKDLGGIQSHATRGFYYSDKFYPTDAKAPKAHLVPGALQLFLGQDFFDDGVHDHNKPDDIATIIEIVAASIDPAALIGAQPGGAGADIKLSNFQMAKPKVQLITHDGGLEVRVVLAGMSTDVVVKTKLKLGPIKTSVTTKGTMTAKKIEVASWLKLGVANGKVTAKASWTKAKIDGMKFSLSGLGGLLNPIVNVILNSFKSDIEQSLEKELAKALPDAFAQIFAALAINDTFEVDPLLPGQAKGTKITVTLASHVQSLELHKYGMVAKVDMGFSTAKKVPHSVLGAIARAGCVGVAPDQFHIDKKARIQVAAHDDLLNQLLYALWYGGALTGKILPGSLGDSGVPIIPLETATVRLDPLLPPILEGCPNVSAFHLGGKPPPTYDPMRVRLQIGDMQSSIDVYSDDLVRLDIAVHLDAGLTFKLGKDKKGQDAIIATADAKPFVLHELYGLSKQLAGAKNAWDMATGLLMAKIFEKGLPGFDKPIVVPVPPTVIDLHTVVPQIAKGTNLTIKLTKLARKGGYGALTFAMN